jgi:hypothetical protein
MKGLVKVLAGLGAILLTVTAVAMPDLCKIKAPVAVHVTQQVGAQQ